LMLEDEMTSQSLAIMVTASQTSFAVPPQLPTTGLAIAMGAPPSLNGHPTTRPPITKAIDIWALGVTLYCFVFGRCPFIADTEFELFNIIPRKPLTFPESVPGRPTVDASLKDLLSRLLEKDVYKRITLKEVKVKACLSFSLYLCLFVSPYYLVSIIFSAFLSVCLSFRWGHF